MTESPSKMLIDVQNNIAAAAKRAQRDTDDINLIAVSKTRSSEEIIPLLEQGHKSFGENRVQEAMEKWPALRSQYDGIELHCIGQLQSNKAAEAIAIFDVIHSLDRISLLKALAKEMKKADKYIPCFLQINIGDEEQKGGCAVKDIAKLLEAATNAGIPIIGLMCIPPADIEAAPFFALLAKLADEYDLPNLSMGMSSDYETALSIGATHIRVGTALFGSRIRNAE